MSNKIFQGDDFFLILKKMFSNNKLSQQIITLNLDNYRIALLDNDYKKIINSAAIITIDGRGLKLLLKMKFNKNFPIVTGSNIFEYLLFIANINKLKIALIGSENKVLEDVVRILKVRYPNISTFTHAPKLYFENDNEENDLLIEALNNFGPHFLFVALGAPRQEKWIFSNSQKIKTQIAVGIGSVFDTYSGYKRRAPRFVQLVGLEWFWRLLLEPSRLFKRYIILDLPFFFRQLKKK